MLPSYFPIKKNKITQGTRTEKKRKRKGGEALLLTFIGGERDRKQLDNSRSRVGPLREKAGIGKREGEGGYAPLIYF